MSDQYFYAVKRDDPKGISYTTAQELFDFLKEYNIPVHDWLETHYRMVDSFLAAGDLRGAKRAYDMILDVYELIHRADGSKVLR